MKNMNYTTAGCERIERNARDFKDRMFHLRSTGLRPGGLPDILGSVLCSNSTHR